MKDQSSDQDIRDLYLRNTPSVGDDEIWDGVRARIASRTRAPRSRRKLIGVLAIAAAGVVLAGGVSFGVVEAVKYLGRPTQILVIGDETSTWTTTEAGGNAGIPDSRINLGPADHIKFADAWQEIVERVGLDAKTTPSEDFSLAFSPSGALVALSISVLLPGEKLLVSWDGRGGSAGQEVIASISTADLPGHDAYSTEYGLLYQLAKIDEVGIAQILAMLPKATPDGYYRVGQWEPTAEMGNGPDTYVWAGASFEPFDQWMKKQLAVSMSFVVIEGMTLTLVPPDAVDFQFLVNKGIALPTSTATTEAAPEFAHLVTAWVNRMITPMSVGHDESDPNAIFVKLPADALAPPDGVLVEALLVHEAFLAVHRHGLPFDRLTIYSVDADGVETEQYAISLQAGMEFASGWNAADAVESSFDDGEKVTEALSEVGGTYAANSAAEWVADGRLLRVNAWLPDYSETYTAYLTALISALEQLNREGTRVALLQLSIDDADGNPILRDVHDFQLGSTFTWYEGADYMPPWMD